MFREMRRGGQALPAEECAAILRRATSGVLAVLGDGDYPYAVPLSFVYHGGGIFFHCAAAGHKLDAIGRSDKASFCVVDQDRVVPEAYTTVYRSVIVFGRARILLDEREKREALERLAEKYSPHEEGCAREVERFLPQVCMVGLDIEHMTGKEAVELAKARREL